MYSIWINWARYKRYLYMDQLVQIQKVPLYGSIGPDTKGTLYGSIGPDTKGTLYGSIGPDTKAVSYTHLTLPTIYSV